jgi:hypothetical protein
LLPRSALQRLLILAAVLLLPACGVQFGAASDDTELFKDLDLVGDRFANRELVLALEVNQAYPVPVRVACYYEDRENLTEDEEKVAFEERATLIGERVLPASGADAPEDEVPRETLQFAFSVPEPGTYFAACLTPASPENGIGLEFDLRSAIDAVA